MGKLLEKLSKTLYSNTMNMLMGLLYLSVLAILYYFSDYWMLPSRIFHISIELLLMAVLFVFYRLRFHKVKSNNSDEKIFICLIIILYITICLDVISWAVDGNQKYIWLNYLSNALVFILEFLHGALFLAYVIVNFENKIDNANSLIKIIKCIVLFAIVIRIILVLTGAYFVIDSNGVYIASDLSILSFFFVPIITLFVCGIGAGTNIKKEKVAALLSYPLSSLAMIFFAIINLDYANSLITISLSIILIYIFLFADSNRANKDLSKTFQTYISDSIVTKESNTLDANICKATLLFCNIHNFSKDMETMEPEDAIIALNNFYSETISEVENCNGKLLEYPGYGLFCIFTKESQVLDAISAAKSITNKMDKINDFNKQHHYPLLKIGVGIDTGDVVLGNVGSQNHMRYSAIGKHVNLASRVETYAKDNMIAISENCIDFEKEKLDVTLIGAFTPKGLNTPINIYTVNL